MGTEKRAYFDHAATTPLDPRVAQQLFEDLAGPLNPSSIHQSGQRARRLLESARERLATLIGVEPEELIFTSGATEAANLAIRGTEKRFDDPLRIISSPLEHACVRDTIGWLVGIGRAQVRSLPVGEDGSVRLPDSPEEADLVCLMHANNETGVLQPVDSARAWIHATGGTWVCDASQSFGKIPVENREIGASLLILSSHKIHGPPGIGCLAGPGVKDLVPQMTGGAHESERRAGTPAVALARAFARAAELVIEERDQTAARLRGLEKRLLARLAEGAAAFHCNGSGDRLPGLLNLSFRGYEGADLAIALDQRGLDVSPGSACSTGVVDVSPVLAAMFPRDRERAASGVRISMGRGTTESDTDRLADALLSLVVPSD